MALPQTAVDHYQDQQLISVATASEAGRIWRRGMGDNFDLSYMDIAADLFATVLGGQRQAAESGLAYVPLVLAETGQDAPAQVRVNPARFEGTTDDGRPLENLLQGAVYKSKTVVGSGATSRAALAAGGQWLQEAVLDAVRSANRQAVAADITARPKVQGWVRMLNPPSCKFCIMLAGKWFRWNQGFQAHRDCDCRHIPSSESMAGDFTTDPYAMFHGMPEAEQNRLFGKNDAQAIRDGADMYRVVNVRSRGLSDAALKRTPGRNRGWQSRKWDSPADMTIDDIYLSARTRDEAIELMGKNGFITGEQVAGGNLRGNVPSEFGDLAAGALGRGGTRKGSTIAYREAIRTGVRNPLEPATQTAAERKLHTAYLRMEAVKRGSNPFAANSLRNPLTPELKALVESDYRRQIEKLASGPEQVRVLAKLLGIL
ncbi:VG15 protein [Herbiconiux solani]|uniref:VG15 protein n=1 Tax=Herbiconiux solani TaxID=661329 RepID=UPI000826A7F8|nr:hypothetical protein [Herbiconiux solani]